MTRKVRRAPQEQLTRKQRSRLEKERHMQRLLIWGLSVVGILIVGVLGYGVVAETIIEPRQPVAIVDESAITTSEFQDRVKFRRLQLRNQLLYMYQQMQMFGAQDADASTESFQEYIQGQITDLESRLAPENADLIGQQVLDQMIEEEVVQLEAERRGITVTADEVQDAIHEGFGYDPDATPAPAASEPVTPTESLEEEELAPTPTQMTAADFNEAYDRYMRDGLRPLGISEQQYRSWIEASLLIDALQEAMKEELPSEAEQVKLRFILANSAERADQLVERLDGGEDFDALVEEIEADEEDPGFSSELDWMPRDMLENQLGEDLADLVFSLEVGEYTEPVVLGEQDDAYYIITVTGHEVRALEETIREQMATEAYQSWLQAQQTLVERKPIGDRTPTRP